MSASSERPEQPTHEGYVVDAESSAEMARLMRQDQALTQSMGGLFPEKPDLTNVNRVIDLACGPGGWVLETAFAYRDVEVVGVDISKRMITYAGAQAQVQKRTNATFQVANILQPLPFPDASFDLVNARLIVGFMKAADWPALLRECLRILRPGGILRMTDFEQGFSNKQHFEQASRTLNQVMHRLGYGFSPNGYHMGILPVLPHLFREAGVSKVEKMAHFIEFSAGTDLNETFYHDHASGYFGVTPVIEKSGIMAAADWQTLYQRGLAEMFEADFCGAWMLLTVWGYKPA